MTKYTMPFEGLAHEGTILLLPYRKDTWEDGGKKAFKEFEEIIKAISNHEHVYVIKSPKVTYDISSLNIKNVSIHEIDYDDSWARDNTLIFLSNGKEIKAIDFGFNAWGGEVDGLYSSWDMDNALGEKLGRLLNIKTIPDKDFILEGGSIHTNGNKVLLTTEACLLSKGRNSNLTKLEIENHLKEMLGMEKVIWLPHGIVNDETNEHIDNMACFLDDHTIALADSLDKKDLQHQYSMEAKRIIENETTIDGKKFDIIYLPTPNPYLSLKKVEAMAIEKADGAKNRDANDRLSASYINFYMGKDFILLPKFNVPEDKIAYDILNNFYKGTKKIYSIESRKILVAGGNIHCVTMQIAKGDYYEGNCCSNPNVHFMGY